MSKWENFEDRVRDIASRIWESDCRPSRVGGVNIDGVIKLDSETHFYIEITENRTLNKVREDIIKLITAKSAGITSGALPRCYCIVNGKVTAAMEDAGKSHNIRVWSFEDFQNLFFEFLPYKNARLSAPFGSAINPLTGERDTTDYVPVKYIQENSKKELGTKDIVKLLISGRDVILLGEYGSGKSRCVKELFEELSKFSDKMLIYPLAIDLRDSWGLSRCNELIRRHFEDLGLDNLEAKAVRAFSKGAMIMLLDGFDEIGSQAWSDDSQKLKVIREKSLLGVKDVQSKSKYGTFVTGREHYFPNNREMFDAIGFDSREAVVLRSKNEFTDSELLQYFRKKSISIDIPTWLPKKPLICQTISELASEEMETLFDGEHGEVKFWDHFMNVLCKRDARIHVSFDASVIYRIFIQLARMTRNKPADVGPISLSELQTAFEIVTGASPVEEASVMLQRLSCLGRASSESSDRNFVDIYILDGLRAKDVINICKLSNDEFQRQTSIDWRNPLDDLGQRILAADNRISDSSKIDFAGRALKRGNKVFASDICASLFQGSGSGVDFRNFELHDGSINILRLSERTVRNIKIRECIIGEIAFPILNCMGVEIVDCVVERASGVSNVGGLPNWITTTNIERFDSVENVSRIRRASLSPAQIVLTTIIKKTFFQPGAGRKEEALLRGLGQVASKSVATKVLKTMIAEGLLRAFKGKEGLVYAPERSKAGRMQEIMDELTNSNDPLWRTISEI